MESKRKYYLVLQGDEGFLIYTKRNLPLKMIKAKVAYQLDYTDFTITPTNDEKTIHYYKGYTYCVDLWYDENQGEGGYCG